MKIVIVGAGKVGEVLCRDLSSEGYDIVLIEINRERLSYIIDIADITGVVGNGAAHDTQIEAGVDSADVFIAVSEHDEINIIASIIAKKLGAKHTIARVRSPEYSTNMTFAQRELGISVMINPEKESAKAITDVLKFPSSFIVETFMQNKVHIVGFDVIEGNPIIDKSLMEINITDEKILICVVERNGEIHIPDGRFVIRLGDKIHVTGTVKAINEFILKCNYSTKRMRNIMIIGGGDMAYYLGKELSSKGIRFKIIEINEERADFLSQSFPNAIIIHGDGTRQELLMEQRIESYDAVVAGTPIDEENIILSLFSASAGVSKNITKISRNLLKPIADKLELDTVITPKKIIADSIIRYVRSVDNIMGSRVVNLHRLVDEEVEAIQFLISEESKAI
ncbi:MAG: Trk system potassium transporter TrkA, partial [Spirochaetales bacterium]|nr:Trk system potassium transporter TrkA [Spirochaetales bacterium]